MSARSPGTAAAGRVSEEPAHFAVCAETPLGGAERAGAAAFVRTPFNVRRNVVKVWQPLPPNLWTALVRPEDIAISKRRERFAIFAACIMAAFLLGVVSGTGYRRSSAGEAREYPLLGGVWPVQSAPADGWYFEPGQMLAPVLWVVGPSLAGWFFVRGAWIPLCAARDRRCSVLALARNLSGTYLYVYLMITAGAFLLPLLMLWGPEATSTVRWCLWCFLFGESFFVPAVMWSRLVVKDSPALVFGRRRYLLLSAYVLLFVIIPIIGMVLENSRGAG